MGLLDFFKKKQPPNEPIGNRVEELVNRLSREGRASDIEAALADVDPSSLNNTEQESWRHLWGIVAFRREDRTEAFNRFRQAAELFPHSGRIAFSLGQEHEFRGEPAEAFRLFDQAIFPSVPASHALAAARYAYLWDELDRGIKYLRPIVDAYFKLGIGDDHFLYMRGLPFIGQTWSYLACFQFLKGALQVMKGETEAMAGRISDYDFAHHLKFLDSWMASDFGQIEADLELSTAEAIKNSFPTGFQAMQLAVLKSRRAGDRNLAEGLLESVSLKENDFRWLEDVRLLALCEIANRFGDLTTEGALQESFLKRQPLLFEPDHIATFQLIDYQERLKEIYRRCRAANH